MWQSGYGVFVRPPGCAVGTAGLIKRQRVAALQRSDYAIAAARANADRSSGTAASNLNRGIKIAEHVIAKNMKASFVFYMSPFNNLDGGAG